MAQTKLERLQVVNQIMKEIGSRSRKCFYNKQKDRYADMILEKNKVYFVDEYTGDKIYAYNTVPNEHRGFSHGGTDWGLVNDFREYIVTGKESDGKNGYGGLYCTHWGYPEEDMKAIRRLAFELGYLKAN